jgi:hypothetical protein
MLHSKVFQTLRVRGIFVKVPRNLAESLDPDRNMYDPVSKSGGGAPGVVRTGGPSVLLRLQGLHDKALAGRWHGFLSSRLTIQWRVICHVQAESVVAAVRISTHDYRRWVRPNRLRI